MCRINFQTVREGWFKDDYWSLCEDRKESENLTATYGLPDYLPGYFIEGLKSWDDFVLSDIEGRYFLIPTVPFDRANLEQFKFPAETLRLQSDEPFTGKVRWFIKPIRFGGDPSAKENTAWLSQDEHVQVVKWWNKFYYDAFSKQQKT